MANLAAAKVNSFYAEWLARQLYDDHGHGILKETIERDNKDFKKEMKKIDFKRTSVILL